MDAVRNFQPVDVVRLAFSELNKFVAHAQLVTMVAALKGREADFYAWEMRRLKGAADDLPKVADLPASADENVALLHYARAGVHWYVIARGLNGDDDKAAAYVVNELVPFMGGVQEISLRELAIRNIEIDLFFEPEKISDIKQKIAARAA